VLGHVRDGRAECALDDVADGGEPAEIAAQSGGSTRLGRAASARLASSRAEMATRLDHASVPQWGAGVGGPVGRARAGVRSTREPSGVRGLVIGPCIVRGARDRPARTGNRSSHDVRSRTASVLASRNGLCPH
jgi:hypothetical protein